MAVLMPCTPYCSCHILVSCIATWKSKMYNLLAIILHTYIYKSILDKKCTVGWQVARRFYTSWNLTMAIRLLWIMS